MKKILIALICLVITDLNAQNTGALSIHFDNVVGNEDLVLKDKNYQNVKGETFNVTLFQYYVSNIKLYKKNGSEYVVPQDDSYFLIREHKPETQTINLSNIPNGKYTGMSFTIGVDSLRNTLPVGRRTGCLDVGGEGKDMYWAWNSGYIFVKMEGSSPQIRPDTVEEIKHEFYYHIGLFGGMKTPTLNNLRDAQMRFDHKTIKINAKNTPEIVVKADAGKLFSGSTPVSLTEHPVVMGNPYSKNVADNYATMFSFGGIQKPTTKATNASASIKER